MYVNTLLTLMAVCSVVAVWSKICTLFKGLFYRIKDRITPFEVGDLIYDAYYKTYESDPGNEAHITTYQRVEKVLPKHYYLKEEKSKKVKQAHATMSYHNHRGENVPRWQVQADYILSTETKNARQLKDIINGK